MKKYKFVIVRCWLCGGGEIEADRIVHDIPELERLWKDLCKGQPMTRYFGGTFTIEDRNYQLAPK